MRAVFILAGLAMLSTAIPAQPSDSDQLLSLEQRWLDAGVNHDQKALDSILRNDFVDVDWHGMVRGKKLVMAQSEAPVKSKQSLSNLQVRVRGDVGVVTGRNTIEAEDKSYILKIHFTDVFLKENGQWQAFSAQETIERPPAGPNAQPGPGADTEAAPAAHTS